MSAKHKRDFSIRQRMHRNLVEVEALARSGRAKSGFEAAAVQSRQTADVQDLPKFEWGYKHEAAETLAIKKSKKWKYLAHQNYVDTGGATLTRTRKPDLMMQSTNQRVWADVKAGANIDENSIAQLQELTGVKQSRFGQMTSVAVISGQRSSKTDISSLQKVHEHSRNTGGLPLLVRSASMDEGSFLSYQAFEKRAHAGTPAQRPSPSPPSWPAGGYNPYSANPPRKSFASSPSLARRRMPTPQIASPSSSPYTAHSSSPVPSAFPEDRPAPNSRYRSTTRPQHSMRPRASAPAPRPAQAPTDPSSKKRKMSPANRFQYGLERLGEEEHSVIDPKKYPKAPLRLSISKPKASEESRINRLLTMQKKKKKKTYKTRGHMMLAAALAIKKPASKK